MACVMASAMIDGLHIIEDEAYNRDGDRAISSCKIIIHEHQVRLDNAKIMKGSYVVGVATTSLIGQQAC